MCGKSQGGEALKLGRGYQFRARDQKESSRIRGGGAIIYLWGNRRFFCQKKSKVFHEEKRTSVSIFTIIQEGRNAWQEEPPPCVGLC